MWVVSPDERFNQNGWRRGAAFTATSFAAAPPLTSAFSMCPSCALHTCEKGVRGNADAAVPGSGPGDSGAILCAWGRCCKGPVSGSADRGSTPPRNVLCDVFFGFVRGTYPKGTSRNRILGCLGPPGADSVGIG